MMVSVETISLADARFSLERLLQRVEAGNEIILTRNGKAVAKLVPIRPRVAGGMKRQITVVDEDWWAPDPDIAEQFGTSG